MTNDVCTDPRDGWEILRTVVMDEPQFEFVTKERI